MCVSCDIFEKSIEAMYFYHPQTKLQEGNIFTGVYYSVQV